MAQRRKAAKTKIPGGAGAAKQRGEAGLQLKHARAAKLMQEATQLHVGRKLKEAEERYRQALAVERNPVILHNLGAAVRDQKRPQEAADCFREALRLMPSYADAHSNLGFCLIDLKDYKAAEAAFNTALKLKPQHTEALSGRATTRGLLKDDKASEADYRAALATNPLHTQTLNNFGHLLRTSRRYDEALALFRNATEKLPKDAALWANLGGVLLDMHRLKEAVEALETSLTLQPDMAASHGNLGTIYITLGRLDDANKAHNRAVELEPDDPKNYVNLGATLKEQGKLAEAAAAYSKAIELKPDYDYAINNLGNLCREQGRIEDADRNFRKALEISPHYIVAYSNLLFNLNSLETATPAELYAEHRRVGERFESEATPMPPPPNDRDPERRLRIGYVSPDFLGHSVAYFIENLLEFHDRRHFHVTAYVVNKRLDSMSRRLQMRVDKWQLVSVTTDDQLCDLVRADGIDILVDLAGHTANNRLPAFARRPAPVQVNYLGYPNTTGLKTIDYRFTDAWADPPGEADKTHSERLIRLKPGFLSYRASDFAPEVAPRPALTNGYVTFGSFNTLAKATPTVIATWAKLLNAVPGSRLMLKSNSLNDPGTGDLFRARFAKHGIGPERLQLAPRTPMIGDHLAVYGKIDIALDPFPYGGTTTTCEALYQGVPVVTIGGNRHAARVGSSLLHQVGLAELIATSPDDYIARATALAADLNRLSAISARLRPDMMKSSVMDGPRFTLEVEGHYRTMWRDWCASVAGTPRPAQPAVPPPPPPDNAASTLVERGAALFQAGSIQEAEKVFRDALAVDPNQPEAHLNLGTTLKRLKRPLEALESYKRAIEIKPDWASAYSNYASALCDLGRQDEAEAACRRAIELDPRNRNAHSNLASVFAARRQDEEAIPYFEKAIEIGPPSPELYNNIAVSYINVGRLAEAARACQQAIDLVPNFAEAHANLASVYSSQGRVREAVAATRKVVALKPDLQLAASNLIFNLNYADDVTPQQVFEEHRAWGEKLRDKARTTHDNVPAPNRRLRVGYVSADFCAHSVAFFFKPLLDRHDKKNFEIFCYSDVINGDVYTDMIKAAADHYRPVVGLDNGDVLKTIEKDNIDILIDLGGHTSKNRMAVFASKPAPLQVTWLGYPNTTGLPAMDFRVVDEVTDPPGAPGPTAVEQLHRIAGGFLCYEAAAGKTPDVGPLPAAANGHITFGSFNKITKVNETTIRLWARVLKAVPNSRMLVKSRSFADTETRERYAKLFEREGVATGRVEYLDWQPHLRSHLEIYHRVDIALDTHPYNGTTTTCEANWMGVPVLTMRGDRHAARVGASINTAIGLKQMIAENADDFITRAKVLAADVPALAAQRKSLRPRMLKSPLCDGKRFTVEMEKFYRRIWQDWCTKKGAVAEMTPVARTPVPVPDAGARLRVAIQGGAEMTVPNNLQLISPYVLLEQEDWFELEMPFIRSMLQPGDNVLDIGANYGVYTLAAAKAVAPRGRIWSFEPGSGAAGCLAESIARNGFNHVKLEQMALSDHEGETNFETATGHAELNALHSGAGTGAGEKVRLRMLDAWAEENGWPLAAFIKLDVEGAESSVMRGGDKYLKRASPLIMFEIRAGSEYNFKLRDEFTALGYDSYQVIPGLNALAPVSAGDGIDGFHLNMLACKPDRAATLAARNLLVLATETATVPDAPRGLWRAGLAKRRFAAAFMNKWRHALPDDDPYARVLDYYFLAQDSAQPIGRRYAALRHSHALLSKHIVGQTRFAQISTLTRISFDLGHRLAAATLLRKLVPAARKQFADDGLPFVPPMPRHDDVPPEQALANWTTAAILEAFDHCTAYSSYYGSESAALNADICKTGFQSLEAERRRQLIRLRRGEPAMPEVLARLSQPGPDNLNAGYWAALRTAMKTAS